MVRLFALLSILLVLEAVVGQQPDECLMKCTNDHYQNSPRTDPMTILRVQRLEVGNATVMCPTVNDTAQLDFSCAPMKTLKTCTDACPDTPIKKLTLSAFRSQMFLCIDRLEDAKKNLPCLSSSCGDVQRQCTPKCGAVEGNAQKIVDLVRRIQGGAPRPPAGQPGNGTAASPSGPAKDVDMTTITKIIGQTCATLNCFITCSEPSVTRQCGKDAYILQRDLMWVLFASVAQSMSSIGLQTQWPDECRPLASAVGNGTAVAPAPATAGPTTGQTWTWAPGIAPAKEPVGTTPVTGTAPPTGETKPGKANGTDAGESKTGGTTAIVPSTVLFIMTVLVAFRNA